MLFKPQHIPQILDGIKVVTRRIWKRPCAKEGGTYRVKTKLLSKEYFALIKCTKLYKQPLGEMTEHDAWIEGKYTLVEYKIIFKEIYGFWDDAFTPTVIEFECVSMGNTQVPKEWREIKRKD